MKSNGDPTIPGGSRPERGSLFLRKWRNCGTKVCKTCFFHSAEENDRHDSFKNIGQSSETGEQPCHFIFAPANTNRGQMACRRAQKVQKNRHFLRKIVAKMELRSEQRTDRPSGLRSSRRKLTSRGQTACAAPPLPVSYTHLTLPTIYSV